MSTAVEEISGLKSVEHVRSEKEAIEVGNVARLGEALGGFIFEAIRSSTNRTAPTGPRPEFVPEKPSAATLRAMVIPQIGEDSRASLAIQAEKLLGYAPLRKHLGGPSRLQTVLQELDITAFDRASVDQYANEMRAHFQAIADQRDHDNGIEPRSPGSTRVRWDFVPLNQYDKPVPEFVLNKAIQLKERLTEAEFFVYELTDKTTTYDPFLIVALGGSDLTSSDSAAIEVWDEPEFEKKLYADTP